MFYCSVHLLEMELADNGCVTVTSHDERFKLMQQKFKDFDSIKDDYIQLKKLSRTARYGCIDCTGADVNNAQICLDVIKKYTKV